jgi:ADP-ribose pyrophosphatase YjhB (NUDIX family)
MVLFNEALDAVLLARRKDEADYDGVYSLVGGKLETTDGGLVAGLSREKNEEIGLDAKIKICPAISYNIYWTKKDGKAMVLPHYFAIHFGGDIVINDEYSDYKWVKLTDLSGFEPKIETITDAVGWALKIKPILTDNDFVII